MDLLHQVKAPGHDGIQVALFKDEHIAIPVDPAHDAVAAVAPLFNGQVQAAPEDGALPVVQGAHHLFVVVHQYHHHHGAGVLILPVDLVIIRHIHPVGDAHELKGFVVVPGPDHIAVDLVLFPVDLQQLRRPVFPAQQPFAAELRHQVVQLGVEGRAGTPAHGPEGLVGPDDAAVVQAEHRHGQREVDQGVVGGGLGVIGDRLHDGLHILPVFPHPHQGVDHQRQDHRQFHIGKPRVSKEGGGGEQDHDHQEDDDGGLGYFFHLVYIQSVSTPTDKNTKIFYHSSFRIANVFSPFFSRESKKGEGFKVESFNMFKSKNVLLLNLVKDFYKTYLDKKSSDTLNGEIIINLYNLSKFNFNMKGYFKDVNTYFNTHLIIKDMPVSSICSFTNTKANYKIGELTPVFFKDLNIDNNDSMIVLRMDYDLIAYNIGKILYFMKDEEKVYFKIEVQDEIKYFFQLKDHIVCICSEENLYFCKLIKIEPYIVSCSVLMPDINKVTQIYGSVYKSLYIIDDEEYIYKLIPKNDGPNSGFDFSLQIENKVKIREANDIFNKTNSKKISEENSEEEKDNNNENHENNSDNSSGHYSDSENEENENNSNAKENQNSSASIHHSNNIMTLNKVKKSSKLIYGGCCRSEESSDSLNESSSEEAQQIINKLIMFEETRESETKSKRNDLYIIKGIVHNYLILKEFDYVTTRNESNLFMESKMFLDDTLKFYDLLIYNNHVLIPKKNTINFYTVPDFALVSKVQANEKINSFLIPNKNMLLVIGDNSIEQFELNTWKRVSKLMNENIVIASKEKMKIIGNSKELYLFENGIILKFELSSGNIFY